MSEKTTDAGTPTYAHMCRDDHVEIGHNDSEHEQCPLCRALAMLAQREEELSTFREFWHKHSLGPLPAPSCLMCGHSTQGQEPAIQHMELPGIVICKACNSLREELRKAQADARRLREALKMAHPVLLDNIGECVHSLGGTCYCRENAVEAMARAALEDKTSEDKAMTTDAGTPTCDQLADLLAAAPGHAFQDRDAWEKTARTLERELAQREEELAHWKDCHGVTADKLVAVEEELRKAQAATIKRCADEIMQLYYEAAPDQPDEQYMAGLLHAHAAVAALEDKTSGEGA